MRYRLSLFFLCLFMASSIFCQSPYQLDWRKEAALTGLGLGTLTGAFLISKRVDPLSLETIAAADRLGINAFDRDATYNSSYQAHKLSNYFLYGSQFLPLVFLAGNHSKRELGHIAVMAFETTAITSGLTMLTKNIVLRSRPYVYNEDGPLSEKTNINARYSFFSGHVALVAGTSFLTARIYADYHPDSKWRPVVWGMAATVPAVTAYLRVQAGKHFPTDVATGYAVGALTGYFIPRLHKSNRWKEKGVSFYGGPNSALVRWQF
jgi:membrane-associated phospholipid phosphatase